MASSMPSGARASVRAMILKSGEVRPATAARIRSAAFSTGSMILPSMCPHFLGHV